MRKPVEIPIPTAEELEALEKLYRTTKEVRLRTRAQIILLAGEQRMRGQHIQSCFLYAKYSTALKRVGIESGLGMVPPSGEQTFHTEGG